MKRYSFPAAFFLGALAVVWVAAAVASSHPLVLGMAAVIGGVYVFGAMELRQFRAATTALQEALARIPPELHQLHDWLITLPPSLHNPVRQRVQGERTGLPGPALTPYLVGLLVMLGMLGTFLGMVVTLNGAVFALEGSSTVAGVRAAFFEPIKGLGLAFGTSVAGVATSAMLGLMSSLARRERAQASELLDSHITTSLRGFSLTHQRQETFLALQQQAQALPQVVQQLQSLMAHMAQTSQQLHDQLLANQQSFHQQVHTAYNGLAQSVDQSLRTSLSQSMQMASDGIRPLVQATLAQLSDQAQALHTQLLHTTGQQLGELHAQWHATTQGLAEHHNTALTRHEAASTAMMARVGETLNGFNQALVQRAEALVATIDTAYTQQHAQQSHADQQRLDAWQASLHNMATTLHQQWQISGDKTLAQQQAICDTLSQTTQSLTSQMQAQAQQTWADIQRVQTEQAHNDQQRLSAWKDSLDAIAATLQSQWQASGDKTLAQQQVICDTLSQTAQVITQQTQAQASQTLAEVNRLVASSEALMHARISAESQWADEHNQRAQELTALLRTELSALRDAEEARGQAAVARLADLQSAVTTHLSTLGTALEAPIARLIETASEAPKAAAEVIGQLRQEISVSVARDNALLEERTRILQTLSTLLDAIQHASTEQRSVIDGLVRASAATLEQANSQFIEQVSGESAKLGNMAAQISASALDVASLGETFGFAVRSFNETNEKLMTHLQRIEQSMDKSMARSDEQLAYYVAQAREIIDLSISAQQDVLHTLQSRAAMTTEGAV